MFSLSLSSVLLTALSYTVHTTCAYTVLDNQCWPETTLQTTTLQSHRTSTPFRIVEIVNSITTDFRPPVFFHLPWPWSYPPLCTSPLPSIQSSLCIYTSTTFASGRGISVVTTPKLAVHLASLPAFTDPSLLETDKTNEPSGSWFTSSIPDKGIGTLALHDLAPQTQILRYTPAFLAYLEADLTTLDRESLWQTAIDRLPSATRLSFLSLMYIYGDPRVRTQDITKANTFQFSIAGTNHLAIFPETSRLNHDCAPNSQYVLDPELLTHTVRVMRRIPKGEEITIAYTSPLEQAADRQARLVDGFHFECRCRRCVDGARSDAVLNRINELQGQLNDWSAASRAGPEMAEELVQMYVQEGLEGFLDVPFGFAALACNAVGTVEEARVWAAKARSAVLMKDGKGADALRIWNSLLSDAEGHWSFRRRL
ncbi:SET domain-containing protein [Macroventuria anomochaeta]|uniref:SET domain-containing protein n=1 Tax=Macroventuria anomochaeta TaxID=301207 RepID=A0ACB6RJX7_9PLEO|nr:SET domain-containing protein [Macroventuria anomochaeta]KAF2622128.1 SET domain-containing protein [Macroventuria anomochaeta]